jgi:AcrR family transcriptional regulator
MTAPTENTERLALAALFDESVTRDRLMQAMAESLIEKGYNDTVVADIVGRAHVSRRTFYEEFSDRGECMLALCERSTDVSQAVIAGAIDTSKPWEQQVEDALTAYFDWLQIEPRLTHALLFEVFALGEEGAASHLKISHNFAVQVLKLAERSRAEGAEIRDVSYATAAAIIGAIHLLVQLMSEGHIDVEEARRTAIDLVLDSARPHS